MNQTTRKLGSKIYGLAVYAFLYLPIAVVILLSFNEAEHSLVWQGFTFKWYRALLLNNALLKVAFNSILLSLIASTVATILGTLISVSIFRYRFLGRKVIYGIVSILILTPEIVTAVSLLILYNFVGLRLGFWTVLLAHVALCVPFVAVTVYGRIINLNRHIFEASRDLGASDGVIFTKILIPMLFPAIASGWLLSFTLSLDDIITSHFVSGPSFNLLPLKIYTMVRLGVKPEVNALCTIMLALTLLAIIISYKSIFNKKGKKQHG